MENTIFVKYNSLVVYWVEFLSRKDNSFIVITVEQLLIRSITIDIKICYYFYLKCKWKVIKNHIESIVEKEQKLWKRKSIYIYCRNFCKTSISTPSVIWLPLQNHGIILFRCYLRIKALPYCHYICLKRLNSSLIKFITIKL